jgi:hypothetical protein
MSFSFSGGGFSVSGLGGHGGAAPSPFDALNGSRLAGPQGSHPLHGVSADALVKATGGSLSGAFTLDAPVQVGGSIAGSVTLTATSDIKSRGAHLRLVGVRLREERKSRSDQDSEGRTTHTENWVEVHGDLFEKLPFTEPEIPATMLAGQSFEGRFKLPAPPLGPPSAHLGEAIIAWALEVRFDVPMHGDAYVATLLPVAQHPDLLAAGVGKQGGMSMMDAVSAHGATISVLSHLPVAPGSQLAIGVNWPSAPAGEARIELHRRSNAPNGINAVLASRHLDAAELQSGAARVEFPIDADVAPSFDGAGLELNYIVRVLVNRRFRPDAAAERLVAIA